MKLLDKFMDQLKNSWLFFVFALVALILWNTNILFESLSLQERQKMELWGMAQKEYIQNPSLSNLTFEVLQRSGINPMIQVDELGRIIEFRNIEWDMETQDSTRLYSILEKIKKENDPILIQFRNQEGSLIVNQKLYYGNSSTLKKLKYYPLALLLIIFLFGAVLYFFFKTSRVAEQNKLWAAMAKETAHQIGTPLTSMVGWVTLLKEKQKKSIPLIEIEKDIARLNLITDRFSKVGSDPELISSDLTSVVRETVTYLQKRSSEHINFKGTQVEILVLDNGCGMKKEVAYKVFKPGFTTKTRGWGLGLSLAKRIIVDFHKGKISVLKSVLGKGTSFQILLNKTYLKKP